MLEGKKSRKKITECQKKIWNLKTDGKKFQTQEEIDRKKI